MEIELFLKIGMVLIIITGLVMIASVDNDIDRFMILTGVVATLWMLTDYLRECIRRNDLYG
jgi:hypothetical protein